MKGNNKHCSISNMLLIKCKSSSTWAKGNCFQQIYFEEGNGYEKNNCCESTKIPTETPSNNSSYLPSNKPNPLLTSVPSKVSTYEPTGMPSSKLLMNPSGEPISVPSQNPSVIKYADSSVEQSKTP